MSLRSYSLEPLVPMTPWPYIRNPLPKSFHWPLFYLFTEGKCYRRLIPPKKEFIPGDDSQLPVRADKALCITKESPVGHLDRCKSLLSLVFNSQLGSSPCRQSHSLGNWGVSFCIPFSASAVQRRHMLPSYRHHLLSTLQDSTSAMILLAPKRVPTAPAFFSSLMFWDR